MTCYFCDEPGRYPISLRVESLDWNPDCQGFPLGTPPHYVAVKVCRVHLPALPEYSKPIQVSIGRTA